MGLITLFLFNLGYLVDFPTTYISSVGSPELEFRFGANGKVIGRMGISPFENFVFGISYGGEKILGSGTPACHSSPGIQIKCGAQAMKFSLAIGFDSEKYSDSPIGVYGVLGGDLGWKIIPYGGVNYKDSLGVFFGAEAGILNSISIVSEGYFNNDFILNAGIRWKFEEQVILEFAFKGVLNKEPIRVLKFSYIGY